MAIIFTYFIFLNRTILSLPSLYISPYPRYHEYEAYRTLNISYMTKVNISKLKGQLIIIFYYLYSLYPPSLITRGGKGTRNRCYICIEKYRRVT